METLVNANNLVVDVSERGKIMKEIENSKASSFLNGYHTPHVPFANVRKAMNSHNANM